ncbi:hypothetical protein EB001_15020 [bacterium]|nr:hypothetical protein [bacterium]
MVLSIVVFLTGISISAVAAYYSIIGLTAIFSGAFWSIVIMGGVLEIGKLVSVSWLYNNWKIAPFIIRTYLSIAVIILMLITSMGIFGYLSKSHIEQQVTSNSGVSDQILIIDNKIKVHTDTINDIDKQIVQIDTALSKLTDRGQAQTSIRIADQQRKTRDSLVVKKRLEIKLQSDLKGEKIKLDTEYRKIEAEIGPIKYVAELIYGSSDTKVVDKSIRAVIMLLIFVFDPLAVLLLIAFNISINKDYVPQFMDMNETVLLKPKPVVKKPRTRRTKKVIVANTSVLPIEGGSF